MMFDTVEADNLRAKDIGPMAIQMMTPFLRMPIEQIMNYDFLRQKQLARWTGESGEYFGVRMSTRAIRALREVRLINQVEKVQANPDQWLNYFTGKNVYSYNPHKSERITIYQGRNKGALHPKYRDWLDANESLGVPDAEVNIISPFKAFKESREIAEIIDTKNLIDYKLYKMGKPPISKYQSKYERELIDEYHDAKWETIEEYARVREKIKDLGSKY